MYESLRECIDMELSYKHRPNILITDIPRKVLNHSRTRSEQPMFYPNDGFICEPSTDNPNLARP